MPATDTLMVLTVMKTSMKSGKESTLRFLKASSRGEINDLTRYEFVNNFCCYVIVEKTFLSPASCGIASMIQRTFEELSSIH